MSPSIEKNSFVLIKYFKEKKLNKFFVFRHQIYGKLIKKLIKIDSLNYFWFEGQNQSSISQKQVGPIKECDVEGQVIVSISKSSLKFYL